MSGTEEHKPSRQVERRHPLAICEECPWYEDSSYAGASGPEQASTLVCGEAPGAVESRTGIPFTGPSGQLLDRVLKHHAVDRTAIRFTNAAACHPPYKPGSGSVVPPREVLQACAPRLKAELAGRETIILLGNTAKEAVLETKEGITSIRSGPPKSHVKYPNVKIIPTIHPAACLRQSDSFPSLVKDIGKINGTYAKFEPPIFRVFDEWQDVLKVLQELDSKYKVFTLDIETGVDKDVDFTHPSELLCIGIGYAPGKAIVIGEQALLHPRVKQAIKEVLNRKQLICHNGKYDIQVLMRMGYLDNPYCLYFDTMLASYVLDERPGFHGLKFILADKFGWPQYDDEIKKYTGTGANTLSYAVVPRPILYQYNAFDAAGTFLLYELFVKKLQATNQRHVHDRLVMYSHELIYVELEGVGFDLEYNQHLYDHFEEALLPAEAKMCDLTGVATFNPRSSQQIKAVLHDMGIRVMDAQKDTIQAVADRIDPSTATGQFLATLLQHKLDQKSYSTYVKGLRKRVQKDGRIYSTFLLHGSVTGRTASRNPNLQNITRGATLRKQFVPDAGNVFVQCVVPSTRVLTSDLRWVLAGDVAIGDELVGFNKEQTRFIEPTIVTNNDRSVQPCYKITTESGAEIVCSSNHKWLSTYSGQTNRHWKTTDKLRVGERLYLYAKPWEIDNTRNGGWLAGILDGEGWLGKIGTGYGMKVAQNPGAVLDKIIVLLEQAGFTTKLHESSSNMCKQVYIGGPRAQIRVLGMYRPERFMPRIPEILFRETKTKPEAIVSIEYVGDQSVVALETTTHTFIAEGYLAHNCDYGQIEGRVMAVEARESYLLDIFRDTDRDLFDELGTPLYGSLEAAQLKQSRIRTKAYFYGMGYGREAYSIAQEYKMPVKQAERDMAKFFGKMPKLVEWREEIMKAARSSALQTSFGRKRRFWLVTRDNVKDVEKEGLAFIPQSTANDINLTALCKIRKAGLHVRIPVHDSIMVECADSAKIEVAHTMCDIMQETAKEIYSDMVPFPADYEFGHNWGELSKEEED